MNSQIESLIELYLTQSGRTGVFLCPQYLVSHDKTTHEGGAEPDFLALDFRRKKVIVVEVSIKSEISALSERVAERRTRWFNPIMKRLVSEGVIPDPIAPRENSSWTPRFLGFVRMREKAVERATAKFANETDVTFVDFERAILSYEYWDKELA